LAVNAHVPAATIDTVAPVTVQTLLDVEANTSGLLDAPAVADNANVPPTL
jgi:hypothetical protein